MNKESKLNLNAGDYAISHCDSDKTYTGLEVHKMLCDAYIAGNNDTLESEDEKVRQKILFLFYAWRNNEQVNIPNKKEVEKAIAWLEKQGQVKESAISQHENRTCEENGNSLTSEDAIEREVKEDAGGYPFIEATELYDYNNDKPLAKAGDKIKVVFIKDK